MSEANVIIMQEKSPATSQWIQHRHSKCEAPTVAIKQAIKGYLQWMAANEYTQSTQKSYTLALVHFLSFIETGGYCRDDIFTRATLQRFKQLKGPSCACAVTSLSRYLHAQGKIGAPVSLKKSPELLPDLFEDYLHYRRKYYQTSEHVIRGSQRVLGALAHFLDQHGIQVPTLRIEHIDAFLTDFLKGFSEATRRAYRCHVRGFLSYLYYERRMLSKDLAPLVTGPPMFARSTPPKFLRKDEVKKLFGALKYSTAAELRSAAIVHLAFLLGLRPCEISSLKLDDIDFGKGQVCLRHRKNNRPDRLPLPEAAIKAIAAYLVGGRTKSKLRTLFLTLRPPYRPLRANLTGMCIRHCMQSAGLDTHAYWLRHTYAQNLLESGSSLYEVKEMLGHHSIESTRKYLHIHIELMRKVLFDETL
jgi:integrase/recombinase XerD